MINIIVFPDRRKKPFQLSLSRRRLGWLVAAGSLPILLALGVGLMVGSQFSVQDRAAVHELAQLGDLMQDQELALQQLREQQNNDLDALVLRLGDLQARSTRVEALGARLAQLGHMDDGEFDFGSTPPIGGPGESGDYAQLGQSELETEIMRFEHRLAQQSDQLIVLESLMAGRELDESLRPAGKPLQGGWLSSRYGKRVDPFTGEMAHHPGIDFSGPLNSRILAVADGVVVWAGKRPDYGLTVEVDHGNGYLTRYAHNSENTVVAGQKVAAGDVLGLMGSTGRATGPHVHFEVFLNGRRINPTEVVTTMR